MFKVLQMIDTRVVVSARPGNSGILPPAPKATTRVGLERPLTTSTHVSVFTICKLGGEFSGLCK